MSSNNIWINNTFTGINVGGYSTLLLTQYHSNLWMIGNIFTDIRWINSGNAITMDHLIPFKCPNNEIKTTVRIENNNFSGRNEPTYIFISLTFLSDGSQQVIVKNNIFRNFHYFSPGVLRIIKSPSVQSGTFVLSLLNTTF